MTAPQAAARRSERARETFAGTAVALADTLELVADVFAKPESAVGVDARELLRAPSFDIRRLGQVAQGIAALAQADSAQMDVEFARLFLHGRPSTAHPYESYYRTGYLVDSGCLDDLHALFATVGVQPDARDRLSFDHIAIQATFLALLLRGLATAGRDVQTVRALKRVSRRFLNDHLLPFSVVFGAHLATLDPQPYFTAAAQTLGRAIQAAGALLTSRHRMRGTAEGTERGYAPILGGVLIGGRSSRMGAPKQLLRSGGAALLERAVAALRPHVAGVFLIGDGSAPASCRALPRISDAPGVGGPLGGMLAAMRLAPNAAWVFCACDLPFVSSQAVEWLAGLRKPDRWMVIPRITREGLEPLLALYEPQAREVLEDLVARGCRAPHVAASHPNAQIRMPPARLRACWRNVNSREELAALES